MCLVRRGVRVGVVGCSTGQLERLLQEPNDGSGGQPEASPGTTQAHHDAPDDLRSPSLLCYYTDIIDRLISYQPPGVVAGDLQTYSPVIGVHLS